MKNLKEFKELILRYEGITLEDIENVSGEIFYGNDVSNKLTGHGASTSCSLCIAVERVCESCVYGKRFACIKLNNQETYDAIDEAESQKELKAAFQNRAKHMRKILTEKGL